MESGQWGFQTMLEGDLGILNLEMSGERVVAHPQYLRLAGCRRNLMSFVCLQRAMDQDQYGNVGSQRSRLALE